jgi:OPA family sugar phosphate sensor protein UhpC-like MFS transporter
LVYASYYLTRKSFGVVKIAFASAPGIGLTREQLGLIDSAFLGTYLIGQFLFGPLADRFGGRIVLLVGLTLSVLAGTANGFAGTATAFLVFAALQGIAQSTGWTGTLKIMGAWFSLGERGRVLGWWCTNYTVGTAAASPFAAWLMDEFGRASESGGGPAVPMWQAAFWGPAAALAVIIPVMWFGLRNSPEEAGLPPLAEYQGGETQDLDDRSAVDARGHSWAAIWHVLTSTEIWLLAFAYLPVKLARYSLEFWGPQYVAESLGSSAFASTLVAAWLPIGGFVGVIASGYVSDKLFQSRRAPVVIISLCAAAALLLIGRYHVSNVWTMRVFFFFVGLFLYGPDSLLAGTAAIDFGLKSGTGAAVGFINGIGSVGAVLGGYLPGVITTSTDWSALFVVSLIGLIASAVLLTPLWNRRPVFD